MEITTVNSNSILNSSLILKPNFHMNYGKKRIERALQKGIHFETLRNVTENIFSCPIFVRVFVKDKKRGSPYLTAQQMMNSNALEATKNISIKYTPRQEEMSLSENQILVSCAGTVGNVKL